MIGTVLLARLALTWLLAARSAAIGIGAQGFALTGPLIGLYLGLISVGSHPPPDFVFHAGIVLALLWGLVVATRGEGTPGGARFAAATVVRVLIRATHAPGSEAR